MTACGCTCGNRPTWEPRGRTPGTGSTGSCPPALRWNRSGPAVRTLLHRSRCWSPSAPGTTGRPGC
ncbi:hypothetical protein ACFPT5_11715 [Ornithinimicrobium kibberense]